MTAIITAHHGATDGIRWGDVYFNNKCIRRFVHDRLNGTVRLYQCPQSADYGHGGKYVEDRNAARLAQTRDALRAYA